MILITTRKVTFQVVIACPAHGESQLLRFQLLDWPIKYPESNLPGMFCLISTMLVFQKSADFERTKTQTPFLPRDYCGACFCLILIHRKALETLCLVTGLAQWAGMRIRPRSRIRRVPGSIPGAAGSDCLSYFLENSGPAWETFRMIFGRFSDIFRILLLDMFGNAVGNFWDNLE